MFDIDTDTPPPARSVRRVVCGAKIEKKLKNNALIPHFHFCQTRAGQPALERHLRPIPRRQLKGKSRRNRGAMGEARG